MQLAERIAVLEQLGEYLRSDDEYLAAVVKRAAIHNPWFTENNQRKAIAAIAAQMLERTKLEEWTTPYFLDTEPSAAKWIGLIMAGNLPLVGFHDLLCVFVSGHRARIKLSDKDPYLLPALLRALRQIDERTTAYFDLVNQLKDFDAVIATGSNNSARYFEAYFGKYPHIIRRNRNGVAVLTGQESPAELEALGEDIFAYFGLGCRNVSKLYVPDDYAFEPLLEALHEYREVVTHTKYKNNFDYNYALFILNKEEYLANGCVLLREQESLQSPIACLHFERYSDEASLADRLVNDRDNIQLVISQKPVADFKNFAFGKAQQPALNDYADGVDTMQFLLGL